MLRIVMCGGSGAGKSTLVEHLQNAAIGDRPDLEFIVGDLTSAAASGDLAVVVIDARKGITNDIYRQCHALTVLGIVETIFAVSKMDLVAWSQDIFDDIDGKFRNHAETLGLTVRGGIPMSAKGDDDMSWYTGPSLVTLLKSMDAVVKPDPSGPFRFIVDTLKDDTISGRIVGGTIGDGDGIVALPSARTGRIRSIASDDGTTRIVLEDPMEIQPGDMICKADDRAQCSDQFRVSILWQDEHPLLPSRPYLLKMGTRIIAVSITDIRYIINPRTLEHENGKTMRLNDAGACNIALAATIPYDPFKENSTTGCFTILDKEHHHTVATGTIDFGLYRADNIHWQAQGIDKAARSKMKDQKPAVLWFTGLSASGKSTVANLVEQKLHQIGRHTYTLDGDNVRHGLNKNLGFTDADRVENIRRVAETSKLMVDAGLICLVSFISPFRAERRMARELMNDREFIEIFIDAPLEICEERDPKGLYKKARAGEIKNFTGFDSPYEPPKNAENTIPTATTPPEEAAKRIIAYMQEYGFVAG